MMTVGVQKSEIRQHNTLTCVKGKSRGIKSKLWLVSKLKCINQPQRYDKGTHTHTQWQTDMRTGRHPEVRTWLKMRTESRKQNKHDGKRRRKLWRSSHKGRRGVHPGFTLAILPQRDGWRGRTEVKQTKLLSEEQDNTGKSLCKS